MDSLNNAGLIEPMRLALAELGVSLDRLRSMEPDPALGNGGLGRLAACFMDSMASLRIPVHGFGIRYNHGLFQQVMRDGWQHEYPENWLSFGNPWEFERPDINYKVGFGGRVDIVPAADGTSAAVWHPAETVNAIAYDTPVVGWRGRHVNTLRLWSARAPDPLELETFNRGDHVGALAARARANSISQILYPSDETPAGQELRLRQEYFFSSASLQDLLHRHIRQHGDLHNLADKCAIQLNDTHPAIVVAELMRLLVDEHQLPWDEAWAITVGTISYTNHTLLPEALETWPVPLMERLLPRHMQIIYEINRLHLDGIGRATGCARSVRGVADRRARREAGPDGHTGVPRLAPRQRRVRAAHGPDAEHRVPIAAPALSGPHRQQDQRYHVPPLAAHRQSWFDRRAVRSDWNGYSTTDGAGGVLAAGDDTALHERLRGEARQQGGAGRTGRRATGHPDRSGRGVDVQIKRIHEYKRQLLNILETVTLYDAIRAQPTRNWMPRVKLSRARRQPATSVRS